MKDSAQVYILEVVAVVILLAVALFFIQGLHVYPTPSSQSTSQLKKLSDGILASLDAKQCTPGEDYPSLLAEYIIKGLSTDQDQANISKRAFKNDTDDSFKTATVAYNVFLYRNMSENETHPLVWYPLSAQKLTPDDDAVRSHRIIIYDKVVYDVVLEIWYLEG